jgi:hypothetical protein
MNNNTKIKLITLGAVIPLLVATGLYAHWGYKAQLGKSIQTDKTSGGIEVLVKVGTRLADKSLEAKQKSWMDGQIIDIRPAGYYKSKYSRQHHAVIELPNVRLDNFEIKKKLSVKDDNGKYKWEDGFTQSKELKREWFIDFKSLLDRGLITQDIFKQIYDRKLEHERIVLNNTDLSSLLKNEETNERIDKTTLNLKASVSSGTYSIGSGLDYDDLVAFEADIAAAQTGELVAEHNAEETTYNSDLTFNHDNSSYNLIIRPQTGDGHNSTSWQSDKARLSFGGYDSLVLDCTGTAEVIIEDMQISKDGAGYPTIDPKADGGNKIQRCILRNTQTTNNINIVEANTYRDVTLINNIIYATQAGNGSAGIILHGPSSGKTHTVYNNTVAKFDNNIYQDDTSIGGTLNCKNNLAQGGITNDYKDDGGGFGTHSKNVSEDATSPDASYQSLDKHSVFNDYSNDDYGLSSSDTDLDDGDDLSGTFTDDIDGDTRSDWYIGADEFKDGGEVEEEETKRQSTIWFK